MFMSPQRAYREGLQRALQVIQADGHLPANYSATTLAQLIKEIDGLIADQPAT